MSDSRIELLARQTTPCIQDCDCWEANKANAQHIIEIVERAGLIVADPTDPAVIDRVAEALALLDRPTAVKAARAVLAALGGDRAAREPNTSGPWDIGDPDPGPDVTEVVDEIGTVDNLWGGDQAEWHRTGGGDWKGYKDGGKTYLSWAELVRRWGPVRLRNAGDQRS